MAFGFLINRVMKFKLNEDDRLTARVDKSPKGTVHDILIFGPSPLDRQNGTKVGDYIRIKKSPSYAVLFQSGSFQPLVYIGSPADAAAKALSMYKSGKLSI